MEGELRPRDIQARVRAGVPVEELANQAGMSPAMVERFAAPVLAERAHMAAAAIAAAVRSTREPTAHRTLRATLSERLEQIGLTEDDVDWDSYRRTDGRWLVTARYRVPDAEGASVAEFLFQPAGRFSIANNDDARGLVGDKAWPPAGEGTLDEEPTVDLADEFAIARAVQRPESPRTPTDPEDHEPSAEEPDTDQIDGEEPAEEKSADAASTEPEPSPEPTTPAKPAKLTKSAKPSRSTRKGKLQVVPEPETDPEPEPEPEPEPVAIAGISEDASASELDRLFAMLDGDATDEDDDDDQLVSDAAAVPEVATGNWPPLAGGDLEPSLFDDDPSVAPPAPAPKPEPQQQSGGRSDKRRSRRRRRRPVSELVEQEPVQPKQTQEPTPAASDRTAAAADQTPAEAEKSSPHDDATSTSESKSKSQQTESTQPESKQAESEQSKAGQAESEQSKAGQADSEQTESATTEAAAAEDAADPAPRKRKGRAAVPSWDEIMFGSPRRK